MSVEAVAVVVVKCVAFELNQQQSAAESVVTGELKRNTSTARASSSAVAARASAEPGLSLAWNSCASAIQPLRSALRAHSSPSKAFETLVKDGSS